jgi:hypothetical protein
MNFNLGVAQTAADAEDKLQLGQEDAAFAVAGRFIFIFSFKIY